MTPHRTTVWIDFENAPHVWVLSRLIDHLRNSGHTVILTARDFSYTLGLCRRFGYDVQVVGIPGSGKNTIQKTWRVLNRSARLIGSVANCRREIALAISHGSRSQILAARILGIPLVSLDDYEYSDQSLVRFVDNLLVPFPIPRETWGRLAPKVVHYPGMKEELYLCDFHPSEIQDDTLADSQRIQVLFRPEGRSAHYRSEQSEVLQKAILQRVATERNVKLTILPRDTEQSKELGEFCDAHRVAYWIPQQVIDGPSLLWNMDAVFSGGGTMTREAAVMGVPSYSFFAGKWGAVDQYLQSQGRLVRIENDPVLQKIIFTKRAKDSVVISRQALDFVIGFVQGKIDKRN